MSSKHGRIENPGKSAYSFEKYDSGWEQQYMEDLEANPDVDAWTKHHGIRIAYLDQNGKKREFWPDFLVRLSTGAVELHETKGGHLMTDAHPTFEAGKRWCAARGIEFVVVTKE